MAKGLNSVSPNHKEQFWRKHIIDWRKSELSQAECCRRNKLSTKSFRYRLGRIRKKPEPVCFVPTTLCRLSPALSQRPGLFRLNQVEYDLAPE